MGLHSLHHPKKQIALNCGEELEECVSLNSGVALNLMQNLILLSFKWEGEREKERDGALKLYNTLNYYNMCFI